ncbi:MAG: hypothetical protein DDT37_01915 [Firmicutes bacterium]|nr:hypothetical protein [candidate division NPL-UPA2 bacterium]
MAHLGLPNAMNAPETLLEAVRVPGEVVVDHKVGALQVDALARCIGSDEHAHGRVLLKELFGLASFVT